MLLGAERPVMIVGQGVRYGGAAEELLKLAERLQIPVAASASGLGRDRYATIRWRWGWWRAAVAARRTTRRAKPNMLLALGVQFDDPDLEFVEIPGY